MCPNCCALVTGKEGSLPLGGGAGQPGPQGRVRAEGQRQGGKSGVSLGRDGGSPEIFFFKNPYHLRSLCCMPSIMQAMSLIHSLPFDR